MESIFLILSGVILAAGILYWLWSHIQLTQKKVQLLENAVFELRGLMTARGTGPPSPPAVDTPTVAATASASAYEDLADDDWDTSDHTNVAAISTPLRELREENGVLEVIREDAEDLQPGGRIVSAEVVEATEEKSAEEFRELFLSENGAAGVRGPVTPSAPSAAPLESMPVKELRRLAEQRGITGVAELRKKELLAALRQQVGSVQENTLDLTVEQVEQSEQGEDVVEAVPLE